MNKPATEDVTEIKISQFREGSVGRLLSHEAGIPVYSRAVFMPDFLAMGGGIEEVPSPFGEPIPVR